MRVRGYVSGVVVIDEGVVQNWEIEDDRSSEQNE